jgi:hypothetical protein
MNCLRLDREPSLLTACGSIVSHFRFPILHELPPALAGGFDPRNRLQPKLKQIPNPYSFS